jgi:hypothetical protein
MVGKAKKWHGGTSEFSFVFGLKKEDWWNPLEHSPSSPEETVSTPPQSSELE